MHPAIFSLIIAAHVSVSVDCRPMLQHQRHAGTPADPAAGSGRFRSELNGAERKGVHRGLLVVLPVRTTTNNFVSMFDVRRKRFLCLDLKGGLYQSRQRDSRDCLFHHVWSDEADHHRLLHAASANWLLLAAGRELHVVHQTPAQLSSALLEALLQPPAKRRRRSEEVNPADPLRSESHPSHSAKDAEQEQTGSVSKETIASVDDPLWVLRPNGHGSPVKSNIADRAEHQ